MKVLQREAREPWRRANLHRPAWLPSLPTIRAIPTAKSDT